MTASSLPVPEERDELLAAVNALVKEVQGLSEKLELYAPREEVNRVGRQRAWRFFALALVTVLLSQVLTMTTISYCFLNANSQARAACRIMPGYGQAVEQNDVRLDRFTTLLDATERTNATAKTNAARIDDLERRLAQLEKDEGK